MMAAIVQGVAGYLTAHPELNATILLATLVAVIAT